MSTRSALMILGLLAGCKGQGAPASRTEPAPPPSARAEQAEQTPAPEDPEDPEDPETPPAVDPPAGVDAAVTHLLAVHHDDTKASAFVMPVALTESGSEPGKERLWPAVPNPSWPDHFVFVVGHGGGLGYAVIREISGGFELVWVPSTEPDEDRHHAIGPVSPSSLLMVGQTVIAGIDNRLEQIDFSAEPATQRPIHERPEMRAKAYDLLARAGDWVVAIDDVVTPIYADSLRLDARGHARHTVGFDMPGVINGSYRLAALHRTGDDAGTLYAVAPYGIMDGSGQDLVRLPMKEGKTTLGRDFTINSTEHPHVLEEHVDRSTGKPRSLVAGSDASPWTGLALLAGAGGLRHVLLAAGPRGLLVLDPPTGPASKAEVVELGAPCHDVYTVGERVFVLVEGAVVELHEQEGALRERARASIPGGFNRWAR